MRLIFIRHAEPDYARNCLTKKGEREAEILAQRVGNWDKDTIRGIFVSPIARAQMTAAPSLKALSMEAETLPWLKEFMYETWSPRLLRLHVPWDLPPEDFTTEDAFYDAVAWQEADFYTQNPELVPAYHDLQKELDKLLERYGYRRDGRMYECDPVLCAGDEDDALVFFCHFGITSFMLSHLLTVSPAVLCMNFIPRS